MVARFFALGLILFLFPFASGQQLEEKIEVQLVQVDLFATDSKGLPVSDLNKEDFVLKEDGKVRNITHFYNSAFDESRFPLTMSFVVDTSYSMHENVAGLTRIQVAVEAARLVMDELKPEDQIELIEFNNKPDAIVPFTSDLNSVREKFQTLDFRKANTAMYDAVVFAFNRIHGRSGRKIVVIFSDGMDSASKLVEEDAVDAIRKSDATFIAFYSEFARLNFPGEIGLGGSPGTMNRVKIRAGEDILKTFTEISGGQFYSFRKEPELLKAMENFRAFVQGQYTLAYTPPPLDKKSQWRKIKVECKKKGVKLRYREGYWAG
jgi:Ca-activated chloride channel family protein